MAVANINGLEIAYDVIGDGPRTWALTPGGRFSKDYGGVRELAGGLAATGKRVLIADLERWMTAYAPAGTAVGRPRVDRAGRGEGRPG
jgi:hypothetical protein